MKQNKKIIIIIGVVIMLISFILLVTKSQTPAPTPTPIPQNDLKLVQVLPPEGRNQLLHTGTGIVFSFNSPVYLASAGVSIDPNIEIETAISKINSSALIITPKDQWKLETPYTITIKKASYPLIIKNLKIT